MNQLCDGCRVSSLSPRRQAEIVPAMRLVHESEDFFDVDTVVNMTGLTVNEAQLALNCLHRQVFENCKNTAETRTMLSVN